MNDTIIVALISFAGTCIGSFAGMNLIKFRISQLEKKVEKHNSVTLTGNVITFDTTSGAISGYDYNQQNIIRKIYGYKE